MTFGKENKLLGFSSLLLHNRFNQVLFVPASRKCCSDTTDYSTMPANISKLGYPGYINFCSACPSFGIVLLLKASFWLTALQGAFLEQVNTAVLELQTVVQAWTDIPSQWGAGLRKTACHSSLHPRGQNRMVIENRALREELQFTLCSKQPLSWNLEVECDCVQPVVHPTVAHHTSNAWRSPRPPQCVTNSSRKRFTTQIPCPWATGTESMQTQVAKHLEYSCMSIHQPLKLEKKIRYVHCCIASFLPSSMCKKLAIWSYCLMFESFEQLSASGK